MNDQAPRVSTGDVYREITDRIIAAIENGVEDFEMPWHRDVATTLPTNALTEKPYNGINVIALWVGAEIANFGSGLWATYKQWNLLGAQVRKGEKGNVIVFYKKTDRKVVDGETGEAEKKTYLFARASFVFNADQVDNWHTPKPNNADPVQVLGEAEAFAAATGADIRHGGDRAYYSGKSDHIQMPLRDRFTGTKTSSPTECYYATLFHELTHWTGHKSRLDRTFSGGFDKEVYAMEELVAELGAAFLCSELGIANTPRPDHAAYVANWLTALKNDKRAIFTAASKASQAKTYLCGLNTPHEAAVA